MEGAPTDALMTDEKLVDVPKKKIRDILDADSLHKISTLNGRGDVLAAMANLLTDPSDIGSGEVSEALTQKLLQVAMLIEDGVYVDIVDLPTCSLFVLYLDIDSMPTPGHILFTVRKPVKN